MSMVVVMITAAVTIMMHIIIINHFPHTSSVLYVAGGYYLTVYEASIEFILNENPTRESFEFRQRLVFRSIA